MQKYRLEFTLHILDASMQAVKNSLFEFGEKIEITDCSAVDAKSGDFIVHMDTDDPTAIFDICAQFGRIKTIKVNELN